MEYQHIFNIQSQQEFINRALEVFRYQAKHNQVYAEFLDTLRVRPEDVQDIQDIPFLPVETFKSRNLQAGEKEPEIVFTSSGTTGLQTSRHPVTDLSLYEQSFLKGFEYFYGHPENYCFLGLLPSYLEREGSSLIYMVDRLISVSRYSQSGFYLNDFIALREQLKENELQAIPTILIGVSFALLDFAESHSLPLSHTLIMETGGMKGRRKEITREELHEILQKQFCIDRIHAEYGMTELLSQAYSKGKGIFHTPPWMRIMIRDVYDPFTYVETGQSGGINVIDLANIYSVSFLLTQDIGRMLAGGGFEILGRFDQSDIRGCNLLVS